MQEIVLVIHLMIAIALVGVILMQQSEGGALGIGGGGGGGGMSGFLTGRAAANILTRITTILGALFIATSMTMAILASNNSPTQPAGGRGPATPATGPATTPGAAPAPAPTTPSAPK